MGGHYLLLFAIAIVSSIAAAITAFRMRRRIRKALGREVSNSELTSINTWMKVKEAEEKAEGKDMWVGRS